MARINQLACRPLRVSLSVLDASANANPTSTTTTSSTSTTTGATSTTNRRYTRKHTWNKNTSVSVQPVISKRTSTRNSLRATLNSANERDDFIAESQNEAISDPKSVSSSTSSSFPITLHLTKPIPPVVTTDKQESEPSPGFDFSESQDKPRPRQRGKKLKTAVNSTNSTVETPSDQHLSKPVQAQLTSIVETSPEQPITESRDILQACHSVGSKDATGEEKIPEMEEQKRKFEAQNRAMAKSCSLLKQRVSDLENQLHAERTESMSLREKLIHSQTGYNELRAKLLLVTDCLRQRFFEFAHGMESLLETKVFSGFVESEKQHAVRRGSLSTIFETTENSSDQEAFAKVTTRHHQSVDEPTDPPTIQSKMDESAEHTQMIDVIETKGHCTETSIVAVEPETPPTAAIMDRADPFGETTAEAITMPTTSTPETRKAKSVEFSPLPTEIGEPVKSKRGRSRKLASKGARMALEEKQVNIISPSKPDLDATKTKTDTKTPPTRRRSRSTAAINYALPSLRKKMRRETEVFVDAVEGASHTNKKAKNSNA